MLFIKSDVIVNFQTVDFRRAAKIIAEDALEKCCEGIDDEKIKGRRNRKGLVTLLGNRI